ncbi:MULTISPECIES: hypothetical protein [Serratia]|uniref:hypothetical protein n=1 Tax=Serratia TaxID=613 RepID=UPI0018ECF080|nr:MULTISPECIES: hypothetical protein [Serratia]MDQ7207222.1 hypothetical protein [Serratia fonticola]HBE9077459.1 hypothetical protein [Serratia fonticola]HBE9088029.1 hypothetical protein [Serratia fonticola]HBE9153886.1 hypothetical protein [Serratia fonticola]
MTIAEYLEQKGREEGLQEGLKQGKREAFMEIARSMLVNGFESAIVIQLAGLSEEELAQIRH